MIDEKFNPFNVGRTHRELSKHLTSLGWSLERKRGDHDIFGHPKSTNKIAIPRHKGDLAPGTVRDVMNKSRMVNEDEPRSTNFLKPNSRFIGSTELTNVYKNQTPGQTFKTIKRVLKELEVRDAAGKLHSLRKLPIRMASGKIELQYPGKSGSSGGGGK